MTEEFQIHIPDSFMTLYVPPGRIKPMLGQRDLATRYELCEDLALTLAPTASQMQLARDLHTSAVLAQCLQAITGEDAVLDLPEARWVMCRLAELLDWDMPIFAAEDAAP